MDIRRKITMDRSEFIKYGPITIVALGDSVTHGAFKDGEIDYDAVYWNLLRKKINGVRNYIPVNVINAGIGGIDATGSVERLESQVLKHDPDLITVCFGLNDVNGSLETYLSSLKTIFEKCSQKCEVIFMTPNMLNTYVADDTEEQHLGYARVTAEMQNGGKMDLFMSEAVKLTESMNITVCDCYSKWKKMSETTDTTKLLANRINHPTKEMHNLFADMLFDTIFGKSEIDNHSDSTMFKV